MQTDHKKTVIKEFLLNDEKNPLGIDMVNPFFSWKYESDKRELRQKNYRITVGTEPGACDMWDSGIIVGAMAVNVRYEGKSLAPCTSYFADVYTETLNGDVSHGSMQFETGLMDKGYGAWNGAEWIGAPEYYLSSDYIGIFSMTSAMKIKSGTKAGLVLGADDFRLSDREKNEYLIEGRNYIYYEIDISKEPAVLNIFRVGYHPDDREDVPFAVVDLGGFINAENMHEFHKIKLDVTGNNIRFFMDDREADYRQINPLGENDVVTFPRMCSIGYGADAETEAYFDGIRLRFLREPAQMFYEKDTEKGICIKSGSERMLKVFKPDCHSLPMFRRDFTVRGRVRRARLYAVSRGIYDCRINGLEVTDTRLNPGAGHYDRHLYYQTYDITKLINVGENGIGFTLSSGWWNGAQTFVLACFNFWGDKESLMARVVIDYEDGRCDEFVTNCSDWDYYGEGPFRFSGLYYGEYYDAGKDEIYRDFSKPGFSIDGMKKPVKTDTVPLDSYDALPGFFRTYPEVNHREPELCGNFFTAVRVVEKLTAKTVCSPAEGVYIYDLEQEIAGVPEIRFHGEKGEKAIIRYGEMLYPPLEEYGELSGRLLQANLRDATSIDTFILSGNPDTDVFCPKFTFHGYRYIEISGVKNAPEVSDVCSLQLSSVKEITGKLHTDNELCNRFFENVKYSQLCNFISIPTDCPQRNERMGWTGDAHVFCRTALYQAQLRNFFLKYAECIEDCQEADGNLPDVAPVGGGFGGITYGCAMFVILDELYRFYGETDAIVRFYPAMEKYMKYLEAKGLPSLEFSCPIDDWLAPEHTDSSLVWNAFYGRICMLMSQLSGIIGRKREEEYYHGLYEKTMRFWMENFVDAQSGKTKCDTQGSYSIGLKAGMFDGKTKQAAAGHLERKVREAGYTLTTGFFGTESILTMLSEGGYNETAYRLMTSTAFPGWLYPVTQGATTIWERWDGFTHEKGFGGLCSMNSFNHYSFGCVLNWFYEYILGIRQEGSHFVIRPVFVGFGEADGGFETPYGRIEAGYEYHKEEKVIVFRCHIPENSDAEIVLPGIRKMAGSGDYEFRIKNSLGNFMMLSLDK